MIKYTKPLISLLVMIIVSTVFIGYRRDVVKGNDEKNEEEGVIVKSNGLIDEKLESGLLLGLRKDDKDGKSTYKTMWIASKDNKLEVLNSSDDIIMPYANTGFVRLSQKEQGFKNDKGTVTYFSMTPLEENEKNITYEDRFNDEADLKYKLDYVGNRYIGYSLDFNQKSGKFSWVGEETRVSDYSLVKDDTLEEANVSILQVDNSDKVKKLISGAKNTVVKSKEGEKGENVSDGSQWGIVRENGHWVGKVASVESNVSNFESSTSNDGDVMTIAHDYNYSFSMIDEDIALPAIIVPYDDLLISFEKLKSKFKDAVDAFISPTKDILLIVTNDKLKFYQITDKIVGFPQILNQPILEIEKSPDEKIIMSHWATYDYVNNWTDIFEKYLNVQG